MPGCCFQVSNICRPSGLSIGMRPITAKRFREPLRRLQRVIHAIALPGGRHEDGPVHPGFGHHRTKLFVADRLVKVRVAAGHPGSLAVAAFQI